MKEKVINFLKEIKTPFSWGRIFLSLGLLLAVFVLFFISIFISYSFNKDKVLPNLYIGNIGVGGMSREELGKFLQKMQDKLMNSEMVFQYQNKNNQTVYYKLNPVFGTNGDTIELVNFDSSLETDRIFNFGKSHDYFSDLWVYFSSFLHDKQIVIENINIQEQKLRSILDERLSIDYSPPQNANVRITSLVPLVYEIVDGRDGYIYDLSSAISAVKEDWQVLNNVEVIINKLDKNIEVKIGDIKKIENKLDQVFSEGGVDLIYTDPETRREYNWKITPEKIMNWINVQNIQGEFAFGLDKEQVLKFLEINVSPEINVQAENARFVIDGGKVKEFIGSRAGLEVNIEETYKILNQAIVDRTWHDSGFVRSVVVVVSQTEPAIKTSEVNDMGITEVLGVGVSDYSKSPTNRIKNIKNAVSKLNGILIKPDEEFSTIEYTKPFTIEGGYYPELVIKGDEVKPEVGGGLCQIGTTLFRMAMNSGMPITQRRNHSLVVSHYNDPVNNLPGTDATVYDPQPDFRFKNDTGHYLLLQTRMDTKNEELIFTLWGTSDGRHGSYTHPIVSQWISPGPQKIIETTKLEPGKKECQNSFKGANASFTYTRILADGTKEDKVFESHYRALPSICLVGVEKVTTECTGEGCNIPTDSVDSGVPISVDVPTPIIDTVSST